MGARGRFGAAAIILLLAVGAAACGGDDSSGDDAATDVGTSEDDTGTTQAADDSTDDDGGSDDGGSSGDVGATVTVGDETFEAANQVVCVSMGGALGATFSDDSGDITISVDVPPPDWESDTQSDWSPPRVRVDDDREDPISQWVSGTDESDPQGVESAVDSYSIDGKQASGSGTFVDLYAAITGDAETVDGTFEVVCE